MQGMHEYAEYGHAAHWLYKESDISTLSPSPSQSGATPSSSSPSSTNDVTASSATSPPADVASTTQSAVSMLTSSISSFLSQGGRGRGREKEAQDREREREGGVAVDIERAREVAGGTFSSTSLMNRDRWQSDISSSDSDGALGKASGGVSVVTSGMASRGSASEATSAKSSDSFVRERVRAAVEGRRREGGIGGARAGGEGGGGLSGGRQPTSSGPTESGETLKAGVPASAPASPPSLHSHAAKVHSALVSPNGQGVAAQTSVSGQTKDAASKGSAAEDAAAAAAAAAPAAAIPSGSSSGASAVAAQSQAADHPDSDTSAEDGGLEDALSSVQLDSHLLANGRRVIISQPALRVDEGRPLGSSVVLK